MNLNQLAKEICKREGKKKQTDIAQVKEILRVLIDILKGGVVEVGDNRFGFVGGSNLSDFLDEIFKEYKKNQNKKVKK